jgi:hypothetical protein
MADLSLIHKPVLAAGSLDLPWPLLTKEGKRRNQNGLAAETLFSLLYRKIGRRRKLGAMSEIVKLLY